VFFMSGIVLLVVADVPARLGEFFADSLNGTQSGNQVTVAPLGSLAEGVGSMGTSGPGETAGGYGDPIAETAGISGDIIPTALTVGPGGEETAGGLGVEGADVLASTTALDNLAQDILEAGGDRKLAQMITDLANKGQEMAAVQASMPRRGMTEAAKNKIYDAVGQLKGSGGLKDQYNQQLAAVRDYLAANPNALRNIPGGQSIIEGESGTINQIIDSLQTDVAERLKPGGGTTSTGGRRVMADGGGEEILVEDVIVTGGNAAGTQNSSNNVCRQGGNTQQCVQTGPPGSNTGNMSGTTTGGG
jgi:hypothetical protein